MVRAGRASRGGRGARAVSPCAGRNCRSSPPSPLENIAATPPSSPLPTVLPFACFPFPDAVLPGPAGDSVAFKGHCKRISHCQLVGTSRVISSSMDGSICIWDARSGELLHQMPVGKAVTSMFCTEDYVFGGLGDGTVAVWANPNTPMKQPRIILTFPAHPSPVRHPIAEGPAERRKGWWWLLGGLEAFAKWRIRLARSLNVPAGPLWSS